MTDRGRSKPNVPALVLPSSLCTGRRFRRPNRATLVRNKLKTWRLGVRQLQASAHAIRGTRLYLLRSSPATGVSGSLLSTEARMAARSRSASLP